MKKDNRGKTRWHSHRSKLNITSDKHDKRTIEGKQDDIYIGANLTLQVISMTKDNRGKTRWHSHRSKLNITNDKYGKRQ